MAATQVEIESFTATPTGLVAAGQPVVLAWTASGAGSCSIAPGVGPVPARGSKQVTPKQTTTYTLTADGATASVTVAVRPLVSITALLCEAPGPLPLGGSFTSHGGAVFLSASGSAYSSVTESVISVRISLDGTPVGGIRVYANDAYRHLALVPVTFPLQAAGPGDHSVGLEVRPGTPTITDVNDFFSISVLEVPA